MVNQRAAAIERLNKAIALIEEASAIAMQANIGFPDVVIDRYYSRRGHNSIRLSDRESAEKAIREIIDASAWRYLMAESGLRTFMDAKARDKWDTQIGEGDVPELTAANVEATFRSLYHARGDMFERGVIECFRGLSWHYKTNLPQKFGKRIVMAHLHCGGYCSYTQKSNHMDDLMRVFSVLDGKPEPDHRGGTNQLVGSALRESKAYPKLAENDYMTIKLFKNGNGHVAFKRLDLVEKLNAIIAKHYPGALPADIR